MFATRAARLTSLAENHPMSAWLHFLALLARAQHHVVATQPPAASLPVTEGVAPLDARSHRRDPLWRDGLFALLRAADDASLPDQARDTMQHLGTRSPEALEVIADGYLRHQLHHEQTGEALYVAAALAAYFTRQAAALPLRELHLLPERGHCPACNSLPVAGVITAAGQAPGARYLHCGLCATAWNYVRVVCITCGESRGLALYEIEGGNGTVRAEACSECGSYAKMFYQADDMSIEPMADDIASLGLDLLVGDAGFFRHAPNPLVITASASGNNR